MTFLADLPPLPGEAQETPAEGFRAKLLARDADALRDRQRQRLERYLSDTVRLLDGDSLQRHYMVGAILGAQAMDVLSHEEAKAWIDRAWEASRAAA